METKNHFEFMNAKLKILNEELLDKGKEIEGYQKDRTELISEL